MAVFHDEVEIEDFEYDEESETYFYPCPCGDQFEITKVCKVSLIFESHLWKEFVRSKMNSFDVGAKILWFRCKEFMVSLVD